MPLKNYTTSVPVSRTLAEIQAKLVEYGARGILYNYDDRGKIEAVSFQIRLDTGKLLGFRLPSNVKAAMAVMEKQGLPRRYLSLDHAYRVSWRIIKDWVSAQMALIELDQARLEQVFLPYLICDSGDTLYHELLNRGFAFPELTHGEG